MPPCSWIAETWLPVWLPACRREIIQQQQHYFPSHQIALSLSVVSSSSSSSSDLQIKTQIENRVRDEAFKPWMTSEALDSYRTMLFQEMFLREVCMQEIVTVERWI
jgi:hypothetical protein